MRDSSDPGTGPNAGGEFAVWREMVALMASTGIDVRPPHETAGR